MAYRKDLERNAAAMMKVKNPVNGGGEKEVKVHKGLSVDPDIPKAFKWAGKKAVELAIGTPTTKLLVKGAENVERRIKKAFFDK